jgi:hypothetical protein
VIKPALNEMFHHVSAINPNLEVYLIDPRGRSFLGILQKKTANKQNKFKTR